MVSLLLRGVIMQRDRIWSYKECVKRATIFYTNINTVNPVQNSQILN